MALCGSKSRRRGIPATSEAETGQRAAQGRKPLCFILTPFGRKRDASGREIDFDAVYDRVIGPALRDAGLEPLRGDEERLRASIHKPMFEHLVLCDYAVADLTAADANVFYQLGVRHALKPHATLLMFAQGSGRLPFDLAELRAIPYRVGADGAPAEPDPCRALLTERLKEARQATVDSPLFQLLENYPGVEHTKTDLFRDLVQSSQEIKERLARARREGSQAVRRVEAELGEIADCEAGVVIDLLLCYRAVQGWEQMIALVAKMSPALSATVLVQQQLAFALNRAGRGEEAERAVLELIGRRGPSSESCGILGRVYKDRWEAALKEGRGMLARGLLAKAAEAYLRGFQADWRDAYPGINAATLMELMEPPDPRRLEILPVISYAVQRRIEQGSPDYWDYATLVEAALLRRDREGARDALARCLAAVRESWEPETTARNLRLIWAQREKRGESAGWEPELIEELERAAQP